MKDFLNSVTVRYKDYPIGGKLLEARVEIPREDFEDLTESAKQEVREKLVRELIEGMIKAKMVTFMSLPLDPITFVRRVSAYCYVAPDSTVQLLRKLDKE